jgi:hypothetical protein
MLLQRERERLLAILESRTATHEERKRARRTLEGELSPGDGAEGFPDARDNPEAPASQESEPTVQPTGQR